LPFVELSLLLSRCAKGGFFFLFLSPLSVAGPALMLFVDA
jgi:hypothetical protein